MKTAKESGHEVVHYEGNIMWHVDALLLHNFFFLMSSVSVIRAKL